MHIGVSPALSHEEGLAVEAVAEGLLLDEVEGGSDIGGQTAAGIIGIRAPVAVIVGVVIHRHPGAVHRVDVVPDGVAFLGEGQFPHLLTEPVGLVGRLGRVELAAVRSANDLLHLRVAVRAGDDGSLVDVIMAADVVFHVVGGEAGQKRVLHVRIRVRVAYKGRILMILGDERLVREDEGVLGAAAILVQLAADPGLLVTEGVSVIVTVARLAVLARGRPAIQDDQTGVAVVERIGHAVQVGTDSNWATEVGRAESITQTPGLRIVRLKGGNGVVVGRRSIGLMVAAHGEEADPRIEQRLCRRRAHRFVRVVAVLGQVADLDDEFHAGVDELGVDLVDDRDGHPVGVLAGRIGAGPLRVINHAELPGLGRGGDRPEQGCERQGAPASKEYIILHLSICIKRFQATVLLP